MLALKIIILFLFFVVSVAASTVDTTSMVVDTIYVSSARVDISQKTRSRRRVEYSHLGSVFLSGGICRYKPGNSVVIDSAYSFFTAEAGYLFRNGLYVAIDYNRSVSVKGPSITFGKAFETSDHRFTFMFGVKGSTIKISEEYYSYADEYYLSIPLKLTLNIDKFYIFTAYDFYILEKFARVGKVGVGFWL